MTFLPTTLVDQLAFIGESSAKNKFLSVIKWPREPSFEDQLSS